MEFDYDTLEVWNGVFRYDDKKALEWWQGCLSKGK
jgi:hypothetical protein